MNKKLAFATISILAAGGLVISALRTHPVRVHADGCDASTLKGGYAFNSTGTAYDSQYYTYLISTTGRIVADGAGNFTGTDTINFDGTPGTRTFNGTYTLNSDCTGKLVQTFPDGSTANESIVVANGGKKVYGTETDTNIIVNTVAELQ
jgi:hypothetical protein